MDHSSINKPKMFDSKKKEKICEEKRHQPYTPEKSQQPGHTSFTKCTSAKKNPVSSKDEGVPDGIPLKPVSVKRAVNPRPGHTEGRHRLTNGATGVQTSRHPWGDPDQLPDDQRRQAHAINNEQLILQEKLMRTAQVWKTAITQDRESSETGSREPGQRRDPDVRTEGRAGHPQEGKRDKWDTQEGKRVEKFPPRRPGRAEQPSDYRTGASEHLSRWADEGVAVMESTGHKERGKRSSVQSSDKARGESQWSQAGANETEEEPQGRERSSAGGHGSRGEKEQVGQRRSGHRHSAEGHGRSAEGHGRSAEGHGRSAEGHGRSAEGHGRSAEGHGRSAEGHGRSAEGHGRSAEGHGRSVEGNGGRERPPPQRSGRPQVEDPIPEEKAVASLQLLSCQYCDRKFAAARLEKHLTICERLHQSRRKAYDSSKHRIQGTEMEKFRQHRCETNSSEVKKSSSGPKLAANRSLQLQGGLEQVTCPHCSRRFAPRSAERHIPLCENIRSRPPPPRHR
ncbi:unnamed protein product [Boreogadus saida]